jgi:hypothetical protein
MQAVLDLHNKYRARHGVPALSWSDSIASKAQAYSQGCVMQHSGARGLGENLAMVGEKALNRCSQYPTIGHARLIRHAPDHHAVCHVTHVSCTS